MTRKKKPVEVEVVVPVLEAAAPARVGTKLDAIIVLMSRECGATLGEFMAATGWQAHSVRGAISGSLKRGRGLSITAEVVGGERRYRIEEAV